MKLLKLLAVSALAVCLTVLSVFSAGAATQKELSIYVESKTVSAGDTFSVDVIVDNNTGISSLRLSVDYDPEVLTLVSAEDSELFSGGLFSDDDFSAPYMLYWQNAYSTTDSTLCGKIATLTLVASSEIDVTVDTDIALYLESANDALDCNMNRVAVTTTDGTVRVKAAGSDAGDINGDEMTSADDAVYILYYTLGYSGYETLSKSCDFNGDGNVTDADAVYLLYHIHFGNVLYPLN